GRRNASSPSWIRVAQMTRASALLFAVELWTMGRTILDSRRTTGNGCCKARRQSKRYRSSLRLGQASREPLGPASMKRDITPASEIKREPYFLIAGKESQRSPASQAKRGFLSS